jgi:hypothetical protein
LKPEALGSYKIIYSLLALIAVPLVAHTELTLYTSASLSGSLPS